MSIISSLDCIRCCYGSDSENKSGTDLKMLEVFFAETKDLASKYADLKNYISFEEQERANKFHYDKNRETYITSHSILRLILAQRLNVNPLDISFQNGINNKPGLEGDPIYFNLTHTGEAFAFAVSRDLKVGIDLEEINQNIDIHPITDSFFSIKEREYIFKSETETKNRFFLLWTRKEALLKLLGTGLIDNLSQVEVSERENFMYKKSFDDLDSDSAFDEHFIYSKQLLNYYFSIAIPQKVSINIYHLNSENIVSYLE